MDQQYITGAEFQDVYDHAGRTRAAIRGFIKYLVSYKKGNLESWTFELWTFEPWTFEPWTSERLPLPYLHQ